MPERLLFWGLTTAMTLFSAGLLGFVPPLTRSVAGTILYAGLLLMLLVIGRTQLEPRIHAATAAAIAAATSLLLGTLVGFARTICIIDCAPGTPAQLWGPSIIEYMLAAGIAWGLAVLGTRTTQG